ncbi:hypothetical protein N665_0111s0038 [Sinapis alba]|nr:hypothetical protein N665_0111s0038 [Sinapis alba]
MKLPGMQKQVLRLYRGFLRAARSKPTPDRNIIEMIISSKNSNEVDRKKFQYIEYLLRLGNKQLNQLKSPDMVCISSVKVNG